MRIVLADGEAHRLPHNLFGVSIHHGERIDVAVADDDITWLETRIRVAGALGDRTGCVHVQIVESLGRGRSGQAGSLSAGIAFHDLSPDFVREFEVINVITGVPFPYDFSGRIDLDQTIICDAFAGDLRRVQVLTANEQGIAVGPSLHVVVQKARAVGVFPNYAVVLCDLDHAVCAGRSHYRLRGSNLGEQIAVGQRARVLQFRTRLRSGPLPGHVSFDIDGIRMPVRGAENEVAGLHARFRDG